MSAQNALFALVIERYGWAVQRGMAPDLVLSLLTTAFIDGMNMYRHESLWARAVLADPEAHLSAHSGYDAVGQNRTEAHDGALRFPVDEAYEP